MLPTGHLGRGNLWGLFFPLGDKQTFKDRYSQWLARALNNVFYDVKWYYEGYRTTARIAVFMSK